jgi:hypothetical protein
MNKDLYLIFVNSLGQDYKGFNTYELLFTSKLDDVTDDSWGEIPACVAKVKQPDNFTVDAVYLLKTEYVEFLLAKDNSLFNMWDCTEGIIPLLWENKLLYSTYPDNLLLFHYGVKLSDIVERIKNWNETYKIGDEERTLEQINLIKKE